jgi:hypothetical protein
MTTWEGLERLLLPYSWQQPINTHNIQMLLPYLYRNRRLIVATCRPIHQNAPLAGNPHTNMCKHYLAKSKPWK